MRVLLPPLTHMLDVQTVISTKSIVQSDASLILSTSFSVTFFSNKMYS